MALRLQISLCGNLDFEDVELVADVVGAVFEDLGKTRLDFEQFAGDGPRDAFAVAVDSADVTRDHQQRPRFAFDVVNPEVGDHRRLGPRQRLGWLDVLADSRLSHFLGAVRLLLGAGDLHVDGEGVELAAGDVVVARVNTPTRSGRRFDRSDRLDIGFGAGGRSPFDSGGRARGGRLIGKTALAHRPGVTL